MSVSKKNASASAPSASWIDEAIRDLPPILTLAETAKALRMSVRHLRRVVDSGRLRTLRATEATTARVLVPRAEVGRYLADMVRP